ncbi:hypothetical protein FDECE_11114 [Fusarium decemcellulare]|nr:hypothetical protein FDECE_11114 [Fusarium decemcellulare]
MYCAPVYRAHEDVRKAILDALDRIGDIEPHVRIDDYPLFVLNQTCSFDLIISRRGLFKVSFNKAALSLANLFKSPEEKAQEERQRFSRALCGLLLSFLMYAQLWKRPGVVDKQGEHVPYENRTVLSPEDILQLIREIQDLDSHDQHERARNVLEKASGVVLPSDTSILDEADVGRRLGLWDSMHDEFKDLFCCCRTPKGPLGVGFGASNPMPYDQDAWYDE